ncbi:MAG: FtsX-like permease family protein [Prolixibacteraceae bacterium]|nr:FtsX-like permease family protein [Prolixibacteraceae bacterium]
MKISEMILFAISNLWQAKLRAILTTLGVVIGIGALVSMVSFGTGMQKNITDAMQENDLFTSLTVTSVDIDLNNIAEGDLTELAVDKIQEAIPLNDSALKIIRGIDYVDLAFPEIVFPAKIKFLGKETTSNVRGIPVEMGRYYPFNNLLAGSFFENDSVNSVIIKWQTLKNSGLIPIDPEYEMELTDKMIAEGNKMVEPDSLIGKPLELISAVLKFDKLPKNPLALLNMMQKSPFSEHSTNLIIGGITKRGSPFSENILDAGIFIPMKTVDSIPRVGFSNIWDFFAPGKNDNDYSSVHVRVKGFKELRPVREKLEAMGFNVFSIVDDMEQIRQTFLLFDSLLGAVGTIALIVAALGIINTMIMSILERTREIGIMKSVGASESDIKLIFVVEAVVIGFLGAVFGLLLGWIVTLIANQVINSYIIPFGENGIDAFYFPWWLISGAFLFSVLVSLLAGLYPAGRAARIDPVKALRHD